MKSRWVVKPLDLCVLVAHLRLQQGVGVSNPISTAFVDDIAKSLSFQARWCVDSMCSGSRSRLVRCSGIDHTCLPCSRAAQLPRMSWLLTHHKLPSKSHLGICHPVCSTNPSIPFIAVVHLKSRSCLHARVVATVLYPLSKPSNLCGHC